MFRSRQYRFPDEITVAPNQPGVLLMFVRGNLLYVWDVGNIQDALLGVARNHDRSERSGLRFAYEVVCLPEVRRTRALQILDRVSRRRCGKTTACLP